MCVLNLLSSEHDVGEDDIYDCVPCEDEGDDIYEDIIKVEVRQPMVSKPLELIMVFVCVNKCERDTIVFESSFGERLNDSSFLIPKDVCECVCVS